MASVEPKAKRIKVRLYANGREYVTTINRKPTKANIEATRREAKDWQRELQHTPWTELRTRIRGECQPHQVGTLGYYMQIVLDTAPVTAPTLINYENTYHRIWSVFDERPINTILKSELQKRMAQFDYTPKSVRSALSVLRQAFVVARDDGVLERLPTDNWRTPRQQRIPKTPYTESERDTLLEDLKGRNETAYRFFLLGFYSGMRTEELLALQRSHFKKPYVRVEQVRTANMLESRTKTHQAREVLIPEWVWSAVFKPFQDWQFTGAQGKPFTQQNKLMAHFQKAHDETGVERRLNRAGRPLPYPWRASYISIALKNGVPPQVVADQTGHDLQTMFKHYAESLPSNDTKDIIEAAFK